MKIYPASKTKHLDHWQALRAAGLDIRAGWLDAAFNATGEDPSAEHWREHWTMCIEQASAADVVLLYAREEERQMGALVEAGAALGAGKYVYLVAPWASWSIKHHPRVRCFETLEAAIAALVAAAHGERLRTLSP